MHCGGKGCMQPGHGGGRGGGGGEQVQQNCQCIPSSRGLHRAAGRRWEGGLWRDCKAEETASAKALRRKCAWNVLGTARWPGCVKKSKGECEWGVRSTRRGGPYWPLWGPCLSAGGDGTHWRLGAEEWQWQLTTKNESVGSGLQGIRTGGRGTRDRWAVLAVPGKLHEQQTFREAKQEFRFRQIKSETPTRFLRGPVNWQVVSGEQHRLQITSCKSSAQRWYLKQWGQMRSLS